MAASMIVDGRKAPVQAFIEKPDGTVAMSVDSGDPTVFTPTLDGVTRYYAIRTTASIRFAQHNADLEFDEALAPPLWAGEEKLAVLDGTRRDRITMKADATTATVLISELDQV